jgi:hypothetical protein
MNIEKQNRSKETKVMDIIYLGVVLIFFMLSWGFVALSEKLEK